MRANSARRWGHMLVLMLVLLLPVAVASASSGSELALRPTRVVVQCEPASVNPGETTECAVTVSDIGAGKKVAPLGTLTLTTDGPGTFDVTTGELVPAVTASRSSFHYTPTRIGTGEHTLTVRYAGSEVHAPSSKIVAVGVPPPNDDRRAAVLLAPPTATEGTLVGATYTYSDPDADCADLDGTVWYRFVARKSERVAIRLKAHGKLDAAIAVFQVVRSQYKALGCAPTDEKGIAGLAFDVQKRSLYVVLVGSRDGSARSTFRLELFAPPVAQPPGTALPVRGARSAVDPLTKPGEAWWAPLVAGRTYRINLAADRGRCLSLAVYAPGTKSFAEASPIKRASCGGYLVFTPGPDGGGRYSLLVEAEGGRGGAQPYRLDSALTAVDDTAPGITVSNRDRHRGSISARGIDVVDLYRFEVPRTSDVTVRYQGTRALVFDLAVVSSTGGYIDGAQREKGGGKLRTRLDEGEYYIAFHAVRQSAGSYRFTLLVRDITTTVVTIDGLEETTSTPGQRVTLGALVTPSAAVGGPIRLQVDRFDPIEGWQFFRLVHARVGSEGRVSASWRPPSLGRWRLHAVFLGSLAASPSKSGLAYLVVRSRAGP